MTRLLSTGLFSLVLASMIQWAAAAPPPQSQPASQPAVRPEGFPATAVRFSPCIAKMGEHWADPKNITTGPIYGAWQGKPVFTELIVTLDQLQKGFSYVNIRALPGYTIDHVDFEFEPHGHGGFPVPDYNIHAYYVSPEMQATICPDGRPKAALKAVNAPPR